MNPFLYRQGNRSDASSVRRALQVGSVKDILKIGRSSLSQLTAIRVLSYYCSQVGRQGVHIA